MTYTRLSVPVVGWCSASAIYDTTDPAIYLDFPILGKRKHLYLSMTYTRLSVPVVGWCSASAIYDTTDPAIYLDFPILGSALSMMNDLSLPAVLL